MGLILDSSVLIAVERGRLNWEKLSLSLSDDMPFMASITLSELWHGCHRGKGMALQNRVRFVQEIEAIVPVLDFSREEALVHARIWADLEKIGQRIGAYDLIIAATALVQGFAVATLNENEFKRIPNLRLTPVRQFLVK